MKRMLIGFVISLTLSFSNSISQQLPEDPALNEQIRKLDLAGAEAMFRGDKAALQGLLPDDHTVTGRHEE